MVVEAGAKSNMRCGLDLVGKTAQRTHLFLVDQTNKARKWAKKVGGDRGVDGTGGESSK